MVKVAAERDAAHSAALAWKAKLSVANGALSKIGIRMELTGEELQRIAWTALDKIKGGE